MIDVQGLYWMTRFSVTGNSTIKLLSKHFIKWTLNNAVSQVTVDGSQPNAKMVAKAIGNNPQSTPFFCCCKDLVSTLMVLQCLALFLVYIKFHKYNEYYCHICFFPYLIYTPSAQSQHEGIEYKVYLHKLFQANAFSLSMYPLIPKFQGTAWLKKFELN